MDTVYAAPGTGVRARAMTRPGRSDMIRSRRTTRRSTTTRRILAVIGASVLVTGLAGCGADSDTAGGDGEKASKLEGRGNITFVAGKDTSGYWKGLLEQWNSQHPKEQVELVELPEAADQQRQRMIDNAQTKSDAYTVLYVDVVWTAEFAANGWIEELPEKEFPLDKMFPSVVDTARYFGKLYAVPQSTNGGLLFYRKDLLDKVDAKPPATWQEMKDACKKIQALPEGKKADCYAGQFEKYEGLTVNFSEAVQSAGGKVVDDQGKPTLNTPEAKAGLQLLVDSFKDGTIPREAITYKEEEGRRAFQAGKLVFHRQWPYQYALANMKDGSSKVAGKFDVAPLPGVSGPGSSTLGGANMAISKFAKNKATALDFIEFATTEESQRKALEVASTAGVHTALYEDTELAKKWPYLPMLKESILKAVPRPVVVKYGDATLAIQENAYAALTGDKTVDEALTKMQADLETVTKQ
ncbi:MAG TPA: ABC transporter substrate-binding protein [Micromonosporaceae bacterium]